MKKKIILTIPLFFMLNCQLMNMIGLTYPTTVKGSEAKSQIMTSAIIGSAAGGFSVLSIFAPVLANVDEAGYYEKEDVDQCANSALIINAAGPDIGGFNCNLRKREMFIDWPIPLF